MVPRRGFTPQGGINFDSPVAKQQKRKIPKGIFLFCDYPQVLLFVPSHIARKGECEGETFAGFPTRVQSSARRRSLLRSKSAAPKKKRHTFVCLFFFGAAILLCKIGRLRAGDWTRAGEPVKGSPLTLPLPCDIREFGQQNLRVATKKPFPSGNGFFACRGGMRNEFRLRTASPSMGSASVERYCSYAAINSFFLCPHPTACAVI